MKRYVVGFTSEGQYVCEEKPDGGWMSADEVLPRIAALEAALLKYGHHEPACDFLQELVRCTCGFEALRVTLKTPVRQVHSKSEQKRLTALGVECVVREPPHCASCSCGLIQETKGERDMSNIVGRLPEHTERHFDAIDAGFFSGDTFHNEEALMRFDWYVARWQREIANIRAMLAESVSKTGADHG
jgi:hypothetical protein